MQVGGRFPISWKRVKNLLVRLPESQSYPLLVQARLHNLFIWKHSRLECKAIQGCISAHTLQRHYSQCCFKVSFHLVSKVCLFFFSFLYSTVILFCIFFNWPANKNLVMLTNFFPYIIHGISICDIQSVDIYPSLTRLHHACKYRYQSTFSSSVVTQQSSNLPFTYSKWDFI